ncbi:hypothetical protein QE197_20270 (plasmid) [Arsenophonus nasoniae]|uniref:Uncharacterized protein n=1 Tax=Arsenophonus nasoniae TaxID=638 RepID=A0A4P7L0A6_9GAMM|nr:hypothetical protein [Arsenophonus nasoniae]QBY45856.1 hypothetical protein ArsFIN_44670 [Arsenophonus nasoniae]WGM03559.1 hypothetical protein QE210_19330 [Arsenophonus nasoniae]WGM08094.1 hypothetical protein QE258_21405 [Arsenophonus nasoniae]WGM12762.1 hypothetical protein QE197_20270 [Arsenophonus nasoniae]WGM17471.1 hypothetical protein QE193_20435 [Arsenophonus nasoniae]
MSITFSTPDINLALNESKLNQVLTANTLEEATRLNNLYDLIDKIIDWFNGGVKHETIKDLFFAIQDIKNEDTISPEFNRLEKFIELRKLANPEHQSKFTLEISEKDVNDDWGYKLKIDDFTLYSCDKVFEKTKSYEERAKLPFFCAKKTMIEVEGVYNKFKDTLEDQESDSFKRIITENIEHYQITQNKYHLNEEEKKVFHEELSYIKVGKTTFPMLWNTKEIIELKNEVDNLHLELNKLKKLATLSEKILSMYSRIDKDKISKATEIKLNEKILEAYDIREIKDYIEKLKDDSVILQKIINNNFLLLPTNHDDTTLVILNNKNAIEILKNSIIEIASFPKNKLMKLATKNLYIKQREKLSYFETKLTNLYYLLLELETVPGYENIKEAPWVHDMIRQLLIQVKPEHLPLTKLSSPEYLAWKKKLTMWGVLIKK